MEESFITRIHIKKVRHLTGFDIPLSTTQRKHLIITGKNGSGKTSFMESLKSLIYNSDLSNLTSYNANVAHISSPSISFELQNTVKELINNGKYIIAYFPAKRGSDLREISGPSKFDFKFNYDIEEKARENFIQYLVNLRFNYLEAREMDDRNTGVRITDWFEEFEILLKQLFDNEKIKFVYDSKNFTYNIIEEGKAPYNLSELSDGYSAILNIVTELIMRMEQHRQQSYDVQGVVLIDEVETHLHVDLQKKILPFLTTFFPKIQFIVTTHSPFVLQSIENAVICDLEKRIVTEDLSGYSYDTIIESYFDSDKYSDILKLKVERYEQLLEQNGDANSEELYELKKYLNEIPKFVSDELAVKLQQIKLKEIAKKNK